MSTFCNHILRAFRQNSVGKRRRFGRPVAIVCILGTLFRNTQATASRWFPDGLQTCAAAKSWIDKSKGDLGGVYLFESKHDGFVLVLRQDLVVLGPGSPTIRAHSYSEDWGIYFVSLRTIYNSSPPQPSIPYTGFPQRWRQIGTPPHSPSSSRNYIDKILSFCIRDHSLAFKLGSIGIETIKWYETQLASSTYCDFAERRCSSEPQRAKTR